MKNFIIIMVCIVLPALLWAYPDRSERSLPATPRDPFQKNNNIHYAGGKLSMDVKNMPLRNLLEQIAHYSNKNIIISQNVKGNVSLHIVKTTCKQALEVILKTQGLKQYRHDKTLFIAANNEIIDDMDADLRTEIVKLNHVQAQTINHLVNNKTSGLLSKNGLIVADAQTNTVLIKDTPERLQDIHRYLGQVDVPNQQIIIRARIVSINNNFTKELGLRYFSTPRAQATDGANLNMDLPSMLTSPGQFGLTLAKLNKNNLLDLELSAIESEGHGKIISSPELITTNQHSAYIEAGEQIPYQAKGLHGSASTIFKKAVLSLKVMPEIVPDNKIILHLVVNHDKASPILFNGVPVIQTRTIRTDVLANNGETIVLGGIYEEASSNNVDKMPLLSHVPVLGALFRAKKKQTSNSQLLIFVTPQIVITP